MENNPGDSSSESDISDPWSIVDRDSCSPDEIPGDNSGRDSISGEPSDGESLEVIDEEERHEEFKDAGMETDGISIITESEISDELDQPLPAAVSKDKKYLHHPNTFLNNSLTALVIITCAAVGGLGLGHFLGLQEECPIVNESTNNLITKLQQENDILRKELHELLNAKNDYMQCKGWECGPKSNFKENDRSYIYLGLGSEIKESNLQLENKINVKDTPNRSGNEFVEKTQTPHTFNENIVNIVQENKDIIGSENFENVIDVESREEIDFNMVHKYTDDSNEPISIIEIKDQDDNVSNSLLQTEEKPMLVKKEDIQDAKHNLLNNEDEHVRYIEESSVEENTNNNEQLFHYDILNNVIMLNKLNEAVNKNAVLNNEEHSLEKDIAESSSITIDDVYLYPSTKEDRIKTEPFEEENSSEYVIKTSDEFSQQNYIYPERIPKNIVKETNPWEENDLQQIKSTLELLKIHFDNDISPETGHVLSSAIALATEYEQGLGKLQETIANCKIKQNAFCIQFHKKMEVSVSKLKETSEELAEDIDEQMYKLLAKIARKLNKFKVNVQNKWCHLKSKYDNENDWFQSSIFLDCKEKESNKHEKLPSKVYEASHNVFMKDNTGQDQKIIIHNDFKNSDMETPSKNGNIQSQGNMQGKVLKHKDDHMTASHAKGEHNMHYKNNFQKKEKNKNEYKHKTCNGRENGKYCKDYETNKEYSGSRKIKKHDHNNWDKEEFKKNKRNNEKEQNKYRKQFVTVDQSGTWPKVDTSSLKQKNISGEWILKMADGRAEQRKLGHRSDWLFDRADARKIRRDKDHTTDNWYFDRARDRENCRYSPHSDWCKMGANYEWHQNRYERGNEEKLHYGPRWSKKFIPRAFATAGKWMKDTFSKFENKFNYHCNH